MIYLIKSGDYLKIGYTNNLAKRIANYETDNPNFIVLDTKEGTTSDEKILHKLCQPWLHRNEWFKDVPEVRKFWDDYQDSTEYQIDKLQKEIKDLKSKLKSYETFDIKLGLLKQEYEHILEDKYEQMAKILDIICTSIVNDNKINITKSIKYVIDFINNIISNNNLNSIVVATLYRTSNNLYKLLN